MGQYFPGQGFNDRRVARREIEESEWIPHGDISLGFLTTRIERIAQPPRQPAANAGLLSVPVGRPPGKIAAARPSLITAGVGAVKLGC